MHTGSFRKRLALFHVALLVLGTAPACKGGCRGCEDEEEEEERERERDHYWRAKLTIRGQGTAKTFIPGFDCSSDGAHQSGDCGPKLIKFKELRPATLKAIPAPGWRFDHWESII